MGTDKKTKKLPAKKTAKRFSPIKPNLWAPLTKEEQKRAKTLKPLAKAFSAIVKMEQEEGLRL